MHRAFRTVPSTLTRVASSSRPPMVGSSLLFRSPVASSSSSSSFTAFAPVGVRRMSTSKPVDPKKIDGLAMSKDILAEVKVEVEEMVASTGHKPGLAVVLVGDRPDSAKYVSKKEEMATGCGFSSFVHRLPDDTAEEDVIALLDKLDADDSVDGVLVQLPLPDHMNQKRVLASVSADKDVDGFHPTNMGRLLRIGEELRQSKQEFNSSVMGCMPCTPIGCIEMLERSGVEMSGANAVIIGRSNIVGLPLALMLLHKNAVVQILHSKSKDLPGAVKQADIVCAAIGLAEFVKPEWLKPGCAVIDVGINFKEDPTRKSGRRMCGDVDYAGCREVADKITPVPGGVGPMTVAMLMRNTLVNAQHRLNARAGKA